MVAKWVADPEKQECVVAFKEVWFNIMGSQSRAGGRKAGHETKGANKLFAAAIEARKSLDFTVMAVTNQENLKQQSALIRVFL